MNVTQALMNIERIEQGGELTLSDLTSFRDTISELELRVRTYEEMIARDQQQMKKAVALFKRYKGWPAQIMPPLSELLEWLMDRSTAEQSLFYRGVLEELVAKLDELGEPMLNKVYQIEGPWLMSVRVKIINALVYGRPAGRRPRARKTEEEMTDVG